MTKKRYEIVFLNGLDRLCSIQDTEAEILTFYNDLGYINHIKPVCDLLNEQDKQISKQAIQLDFLKAENSHIREVLEENKRLKAQLKGNNGGINNG